MPFTIESVHLSEVKVIVPTVFEDERGFFMEAYRKDSFAELGITCDFVQDNHSRSSRGVIRGLHLQWDPPMAKLMRVTQGTVFMVAVDVRKGSPTLGQWVGLEVSAENKRQVWAPANFARGFCVLSEIAEVEYKCSALYTPRGERAVRWNDEQIGIDWPLKEVTLSEKDRSAPGLATWLASEEAEALAYHQVLMR